MKSIKKILLYVSSFFVSCMAILVTVDILARYFFNSPIQGAYDLAGNLLAIVSAVSLAVVTLEIGHIEVELFYSKLSLFWRRRLSIFIFSIQSIIFTVFFWQSTTKVYEAIFPHFERTPSPPYFKVFPFRLALAAGFLFAVIASIYLLIRSFSIKSFEALEKQNKSDDGSS